MKLSHTSKRTSRLAKDERLKKARRAIARMMEAMESRILMSSDWLNTPTAEWRQPAPTAATQAQLEPFPAATVVANGSLRYTTSWVANSYAGYPVTSPDGGTTMYDVMGEHSMGVAAGPVPSGQTLSLMAVTNNYAEEGDAVAIYQDGQVLSTNSAPGVGGGRGVVFSSNYAFAANSNGIDNIKYYTVVRYDLKGAPANFTSGIGAGQNCFGNNIVNDGKSNRNYIYTSAIGGSIPSALAYDASNDTLYVTDNLDNTVYAFNATTGAMISTSGVNGVNFSSTGAQSITASGTGGVTWATGNLNVQAAITTKFLSISTLNSAVAGGALSVTVTARDASGNTVTGYTGTVSFSSTDSQATLPGTLINGVDHSYTFTAQDAGVHTFTVDLQTVVGSPWTITARDITNGFVATTSPISVASASPVKTFVISAVTPTGPTAGTPVSFSLTAQNDDGTTATTYTGTVQFTSSDPKATMMGYLQDGTLAPILLAGGTPNFDYPYTYTFTPADAGVHVFGGAGDYTLPTLYTKSTSQTITATDVTVGYLTATSGNINVKAGTLDHLAVTSSLSTNSVALKYYTTGTTTANTTFDVTVTAQDKWNNALGTGNDTVSLGQSSSNGGSVTFPLASHAMSAGKYTFTGANAVKTNAAGLVNITASDTSTQGIQQGTLGGITITSATYATKSFVISTIGGQTAGTPFTLTVTAKKNDGVTTDATYTGAVQLASTDSQAQIWNPNTSLWESLATTTYRPSFTAGVLTLTNGLQLRTGGWNPATTSVITQTITVTDPANSVVTATSGAITVNANTISKLGISGLPAVAAAGGANGLTLAGQDVYGNIVNSYQGTVSFSSTDSQLGHANYTFIPADNGVHTFNGGFTFKTPGTQTVTATDTVTGTIKGTSNGVSVLPQASVESLDGTTSIGSIVVTGSYTNMFDFTVTARDHFGNVDTGYTGTISFAGSAAGLMIGSTPASSYQYKFTGGNQGVHTFTNLKFSTPGLQQLIKVTDIADGSLTDGVNVDVLADTNSKTLAFGTNAFSSTQVTAGDTANPISFTVTAYKNTGRTNVDTAYVGTVRFATTDNNAIQSPLISSDNGATWATLSGATYLFTTGTNKDNGAHTFLVKRFCTAGSQTLTVEDIQDNSITLTTSPITVTPAAAASLNFSTLNGYAFTGTLSVAAGTPFNVSVTAKDPFGNIADGYTGTVTFTHTGSASAPQTYTFNALDHGVKTFADGSFLLNTASGYGVYDLALDSSHNLWITDRNMDPATGNATTAGGNFLGDGNVYKYDTSSHTLSTPIAGLPTDAGSGAMSVAWDTHGNRLVVALGGRVGTASGAGNTVKPILFYNTSGTQTGTYGSSLYSGTPGEMGANKLSFISDIDVDAAGNLYVATQSRQKTGDCDVRVLDLTDAGGKVLYAENKLTYGPTAIPDSYKDGNGVIHDALYTMNSYFTMDYSRAPGDQWIWAGVTSDPQYTADVRTLGRGGTDQSVPDDPIIRRLSDGNTYMYMLASTSVIEVYKQDASSDIFRPVSIISLDAKGDPVGSGFPFSNGQIPTQDQTQWIWTDGSNSNPADGIAQSGEFAPFASNLVWGGGFRDANVDDNGNIIFEEGIYNAAAGDRAPAVIVMKPNLSGGCLTYTYASSGLFRVHGPNYSSVDPNPNTADPQWGVYTSGSHVYANNIGGITYDSKNHVLYVAGGPSDGSSGNGTVLRAYNFDPSNITVDGTVLGDAQSPRQWSDAYDVDGPDGSGNLTLDPNGQLTWLTLNGNGDVGPAMHTMTCAGDYLFVESRNGFIYTYNRSDGKLAGNVYPLPVDSMAVCSPDTYASFQAIQRPVDASGNGGDYIVVTEGFFSQALFQIMPATDHVPTVSFSQDVITSTSSSPVTVTFKATASDPDGDPLTYNWQFGDGTFAHSSTATVTHTYTYAGAFSVDLVVSDGKSGAADAASLVTIDPAGDRAATANPRPEDMALMDNTTNDVGGVFVGVPGGPNNQTSTTLTLGGASGTTNYCDLFPFDLWDPNGLNLKPHEHVSTATLPTLSFVLQSITDKGDGIPNADLYAAGMYSTVVTSAHAGGLGNLYYAGTGDTAPGAVLLQQNYLIGSGGSKSPIGSRLSINSAAQLALANYINTASDAGDRFIVLRLSPQTLSAGKSGYSVYTSESGSSTAPQLGATVQSLATVSNPAGYNVLNNALAVGLSQYGDTSGTFSTIPAKYLGMSYIRTASGDHASSSGSLQFTANQSVTVYVLYDDALAAHKPSWLTSGFADTNDNIVTTAGTFSVYKNNADYAAGTISLGANTFDGYATGGSMYSVLIAPSLPTTGLVGYWKFDEGSGTTAVNSISAATTTVSGNGPTWNDGYLGNAEQFEINLPGAAGGPAPLNTATGGSALHFDGKTNVVSVVDSGQVYSPSNISVSLWAMNDFWQKPQLARNGWNGQSYLINKTGSFYIKATDPYSSTLYGNPASVQTLEFGAYIGGVLKTITYTPPQTTNVQPNNDFNLFQWHQYGLSYDGSTLTAYVDGHSVGIPVTGLSGSLTSNTNSLTIGGDGSANYFQGSIDDVRIYNSGTVNMQALSALGGGVSSVANAPTPLGASTAVSLTGLTTTLADTALGSFTLTPVSSATAGNAFSVTVTALNTLGQTLTSYTGTVHFTSSDGQVSSGNGLPSDYTFVSGDAGAHSFNVTLKTVGNQSVTVAAGAINATDSNIAVSAAAASQAVITTQPSSSATAGTAFATQPVITLKDAYGNVCTNDSTHTVTAVSNGSALLQGTLTVTLVNGVATFTNLSYNKAETMTIGFSSNAGGVSSATSGNIVVGAAAASQAVITTQPSGAATAGTAFATQPVVKLEDTYGNVVSDSTHTVTAVSNGSALLQGTLTVTLVNGVATFTNLSYNKAETLTIGFSTNAGSETATSNNIVVSPAAASQLVITQQPSATATVGVAFATQPIVQMRDAYNNVITTDSTHTVTAARNLGSGTLQGTTTVTEVNGVATFTNLSYNTAETMNIRFSSNLGGVSTADSSNVVVSPGTVPVTIAATSNATEGGSNGSFTVTRTGTAGDLVVNYSIGGSAVNGTDDTALSGTVTILNGSSTATITVAATNDTVAELTETVDLTLTSGTGYTVGSPNYATVNIIDNDSVGYLDSGNLKGYWPLDEGSGTTASDFAPVATPDTGTVVNTPNWAGGYIGNAYHANKTSNYYVSIANSSNFNFTTALTVSVWGKGDTGTNWASGNSHALVHKNSMYEILPVANSTNMKFGVYVGGAWKYATFTGALSGGVGVWHHYAMTWNGSTITAYVDGASVATFAASGTLSNTGAALWIGADNSNGTSAFTGYVDEVRLYNAVLSSTDVSALYGQSVLSVTGLQVNGSHGASYSVASNLQSGNTLYGDAANTFSTIPAKYLGSTLLKTANADANSVGDKQLGFTLNQNSVVYVLYDDAIASGHRASDTGGWLASGNGFTDTGDNVVDSSGHTFSVYKASVSAGTLWLGGNTLDGVNGTGLMYDVLVQPLL